MSSIVSSVSVDRITPGELEIVENVGLTTNELLGQIQASEFQLR